MQRSLQRKLLGRNTARNAWLHMLDERLPRLEAPTTAAAWARHARQTRADLLDLFFQGHPRELLQEPDQCCLVPAIELIEADRALPSGSVEALA